MNDLREEMVTISVDFSTVGGYPLVKNKVSPFNSVYVSEARWLRDQYMADELNISSLRYETAWGIGDKITTTSSKYDHCHELTPPQISGTVGNLQYNYTGMNHITDALNADGLKPMYIHCYNPLVLSNDGTMTSKPSSMTDWQSVNEAFASHWRSTGRKIEYYEIWNEPDLTNVFFTGTKEDYFDIYHYGSQGVKAGDPDAKVGGPALAYRTEWGSAFLNYVGNQQLPLDFYSYHVFSNPQNTHPIYRNHINGRFFTTELILSEYNSYRPGIQYPEFHQDGAVDTNEAAYMLLHDFKYFMSQPDLAKVYWAQFNDPEVFSDVADRCGIINNDGRRKASFNAFRIYGEMPVDRKQLIINDTAVEGFASSDSHKSAVALWNMSETDKELGISFSGIPFLQGLFKLYRIDESHANYNIDPQAEELIVTEKQLINNTTGLTWTGTLPGKSVVYITIEDGTFLTDDAVKHVADIIRTNRYFFERHKSHYAEFDEKSWIARLGMVNENYADSLVGVTVENLLSAIQVNCETTGTIQDKDRNSLLGIRIDYMVNGSYQKGVLFHNGLYHSNRESLLPWGTKGLPDQVIQITDFSEFNIIPSLYAPDSWNNGRAILSFELQNAGAGASVKFSINKVSGHEKRLVNWYQMEESGNLVVDKTGNGFAAQVYGGAIIGNNGIVGKAISFNGTNVWLSIPKKIEDDFSISFWMRTEQTGGSAGPWYYGYGLIDGECAGVTNDFGISLLQGKLAFGVGNPDTTIYSQVNVNDGKWHHCTCTRNKTDGAIRLFVDGHLEASGVAGMQTLVASTELNAGRIHTGFNYYNGLLADIRIYNYVIPEGLVGELSGRKYLNGRYSFDSIADAQTADSSDKHNHMTLFGTVGIQVGQKNNALAFSGNGYGAITRNVTDDFTIGFWVKTTQASTGTHWYEGIGIIDGECPGVVNDFGVSLVGNKLAFGTGSPDTTIHSITDINDGEWHYCTATRQRPDGKMRIYVDGVLEAEATGGKKSLYTPLELNVGRTHNSETRYFVGLIDELTILNKALSPNEVAALADSILEY